MRSFLLIGGIVLAGCGNGTGAAHYSVQFAALVGGQPFSCQQTYSNIGTTKSALTPLDLRMYVHDVTLVRASGEKHPLTLDQDGKWQLDNIAFIDFEDGTGSCSGTGTTKNNTVVTGSAPSFADYNAVQFTLGVPTDHDHLDATIAKAPLNQPAMFWGWMGGYRYLRVDVQSTANPSYVFHLGAVGCTGAGTTGIDCKYNNLSTIVLSGFTPNQSRITLDLATLFADSNLDFMPDGVTTFTSGCMSAANDPQCPPVYAKLGLAFQNMGTPPPQTAFGVQ